MSVVFRGANACLTSKLRETSTPAMPGKGEGQAWTWLSFRSSALLVTTSFCLPETKLKEVRPVTNSC